MYWIDIRSRFYNLLGVLSIMIGLTAATGLLWGHAPVRIEGGYSLKDAAEIQNPSKSWIVYTDIQQARQPRYYFLSYSLGDRIKLVVTTPEPGPFIPDLVLMGPGLEPEIEVPSFVELPEGQGSLLVQGKPAEPVLEPFTSTAIYKVIELDTTAPADGVYYVAIYSNEQQGKFALAPGYLESFTVRELIMLSIDIPVIHIWEGQHPVIVFFPMLAVLLIGLIYLRRNWRVRRPASVNQGLAAIAGLICLGSAAITLYQTIRALAITGIEPQAGISALLICFPTLGGCLLLSSSRAAYFGIKARIKAAFGGIVGLTFWAGLLIGPFLALIAALLPTLRTKGQDVDGRG